MSIKQPYGAVVPYLNVRDGREAVEFYRKAFVADLIISIAREGGKLAHSELKIGPATFMVRDDYPDYHFFSPKTVGGASVNLLVYVDDVRAFTDHAVEHGAKLVRPVSEQFHGDLQSELTDPYGHSWFFSTRTREMTESELHEAAKASRI